MLKKYSISTFFSILMASLLGVFGLIQAIIIERMLLTVQKGNLPAIYQFICIIVIYILLYGGMYFFSKTLNNLWTKKVSLFLKRKLYRNILKLDYKHFCKRDKTEYLALVTDFAPYMEGYFRAKKDITVNVIILISSVAFIGYFNGALMLLTVVLFAGYHCIRARIMEEIRKSVKKIQEVKSTLYGDVVESVSHVGVIKGMQAEAHFAKKNLATVKAVSVEMQRYQFLYNLADILFFFIQCMMTCGILILGYCMVDKNADVIITLIAINEVLTTVLLFLTEIESSEISKKACKEYYDIMNEIEKEAKEENVPTNTEVNDSYDVELQNVFFSYGEKAVLKDFSVCFEQGKKYAIVGPSGNGKTTLLNLLLKNAEPSEGTITIGNIDYRQIDREKIQSLIAYVSQDSFLFHNTIRNNICLEKNKSSEWFQEVSKKCFVDKITEKLPEKDETVVTYSGNLSEGEKQRVSLARAVYTEKPIFLLDEYTSAMDADLSEKIEEMILKETEKTIIVVTHKLKAEDYAKYDKVIAV